ncbi:hypothetical protein LRS10_21875 [Phenylobacterium sp. J426]|uniref:ShlB/FhaC/HecB family hemolysin secretion/activation protein n=1 Tax=Phenylobacterium sp. J426 TaxID=2898439 RepID=UPI002150EAC3|nr:ShlB/FhaC/HecB family hemolysin secretion/activation protein [Phenylobacterium sp. J426]MCR5876560.1 hypothetical protein [Phenylobacterium sp. J426]
MIRAITLRGASLPEAQLKAAWAPFIGRALDTSTLQALANAVTGVYASSDFAIYKVFIPVQTFAGGEVVIAVTEGYIGQVAITGDVETRHLRLLKKYSAKLTEEKPLQKPRLERYLSLIRDIPGMVVEPKLTESRIEAAYLLTLDIERKRVSREITISDRGTPRLGRTQAQAVLVVNSLLQQGDQTRITVAAPVEIDPFQYYAISHSAPIGSEGLRVTASIGRLRTRPKDSPITGEATTAGVAFTYPLIRSYGENLYLTAGLDGQDSDNAVYGQTFSSDHTRAARLSLSWSKQSARQADAISATGSWGLDILGADADARLTDDDFKKLNLYLGRDRALGEEWVARWRGTAQLSDGRLPAAEQLALGGEQFGRAFGSATLTGDYGAAGSFELGWSSKSLWPRSLDGSELYGFVDWGKVWIRSRFDGLLPEQEHDLGSVGAGVRLNWRRKVVFNVEGAKAIETPYGDDDPWKLLFGWRSLF